MADHRFDNRVAVITGGGRGLGRAYALLLASRGARIVVNDNGSAIVGEGVDKDPAEEVVREIRAAGGEAVACTDSVATPAGGKAIVQAALDKFGRLDIVIHSAGNVRYGALDAISQEDFRAVVDVHFLGAFNVVRPAFERMVKDKYGRVILTSSIGGIYGNAQVVPYSMSKAGMIGLNNVIALEGAPHNIKSNIILPAAVTRMSEGVDTSQFPSMPPELVAPVVGWLAHERCSVTGEMYISAAGRVARALVAETEGVFQQSWSIEQVEAKLDAIRDTKNLWMLPPVPTAFMDHLGRSFAMASKG